MRDLFEHKDIGIFTTGYQVIVPAHGCRIYKAVADERLERRRYEAETAYISDYQDLKNNQQAKTGIYTADDNCSGGYKACWLGMSEQNDLVWNNVYSPKGGKYTLTIAYLAGDSRNMSVSVNGKAIESLTVKGNGWDKTATVTLKVKLKKGKNNIRLSNPNGWMPDIDYIELKK